MTEKSITRNTNVSIALLISIVAAAVWITVLIKDLEATIGVTGQVMVDYHKRLDKVETKMDNHVMGQDGKHR